MNDATLKHLASLSKSLNEASDTLSKQIAAVEAALNELKLGVWAWVEVSRRLDDESFKIDGKPAQFTRVEHLGYGKRSGKWGLLYSISFEDHPEPEYETVMFLRDAPRMEKIEAVEKIPDLIRVLESNAVEVTKKATAQAVKVGDVAAALKKVGGNHVR
jgi:hypothetical protein